MRMNKNVNNDVSMNPPIMKTRFRGERPRLSIIFEFYLITVILLTTFPVATVGEILTVPHFSVRLLPS